jgi:capsular exopolysaccharide synthesis family protein
MSDNKPFDPSQNGNESRAHYRGEYMSGNPPYMDDDSDEIDLKLLLAILLRRKWYVIGFTFLFTILSGIYAFSVLPVYESNGSIIITESQPRMTGAGGDLTSLLATTYGIGAGSTISNELQVIKSRKLSEVVADRMIEIDTMEDGRRFPLLWRDFPRDSTVITRDSIATRIRENMQAVRIDRDTDVVRVSFESFSPLEAAWMVDRILTTYSDLSLDQNRQSAGAALEFLRKERDEISNTLNVTENDLREYMNETQLVLVDEQTKAVIERVAALEAQRQEVRVMQVAANSAIAEYENQLDLIRPGLADQFAESIGPTMERLQYTLSEDESTRIRLLIRNPELRENPELEPQMVELNKSIAFVKNEINELAQKLTGEGSEVYLGMLNTTGDGGIAARLSELTGKLIELRVQKSQYDAQEQVLDERLAIENAFFDNLPDNMIELARLQRDAMINEQLYLTISRQYAETALWEQTQFGLGNLLDTAFIPEKPSKPVKRLYVMVGFLLGGIVGVGFAFLRETMNRTIDGSEKVKRTGITLLSVIPDLKVFTSDKLKGRDTVQMLGRTISTTWVSLIDAISPAAESFRRLHNNILYSHPDEKFQTILVTSTNKGEGKTTVAANLAVTLSESGKKVIVIDTDLRRPSLHNITGEKRMPGLTEVLFENIPLSDVICESAAPGVDVITSGHRPPNPSSVMQSKKLRDTIKELQKMYDHVIIDSAPYGIITDAAPMMRLADGVLIVVRFNQTQTNELNHTIENLKRINVNILGAVLTAYDHEKSTDYYYSETNYNSYEAYDKYHANA